MAEYASTAEMRETYRKARRSLYGRPGLSLAGPEERLPETLANLPVIVTPYRLQIRRPETPAWMKIVKEVAEKRGVEVRDVLRPTRRPAISMARLECYYRIRNECNYSFPEIAHRMDCQDASAVIAGSKKYARLLAEGRA